MPNFICDTWLSLYNLNLKGVTMSKDIVECPKCKEVAVITKDSLTTVIDCDCGTIEMDSMNENDPYYIVYDRFLTQYGNTISPIFTDADIV